MGRQWYRMPKPCALDQLSLVTKYHVTFPFEAEALLALVRVPSTSVQFKSSRHGLIVLAVVHIVCCHAVRRVGLSQRTLGDHLLFNHHHDITYTTCFPRSFGVNQVVLELHNKYYNDAYTGHGVLSNSSL